MTTTTFVLLASALSIGVFHTVLGPDHYLPFIAMARAGGWSRKKTMLVTTLCGLGHIAGSVLLGMVGIAFGISLSRLEAFESSRGSWAAWALILFGLLYTLWGLRRAARKRPHTHVHAHANGTIHKHEHRHEGPHLHPHPSAPEGHEPPTPEGKGRAVLGGDGSAGIRGGPATASPGGSTGGSRVRSTNRIQEGPSSARMTPWVLFVVFLLGPCEALIPLLMFPAAMESWSALLLVTGTFGAATLATMVGLVFLGLEGSQRIRLPLAQGYGHVVAGVTVLLCGVAIQFLGV